MKKHFAAAAALSLLFTLAGPLPTSAEVYPEGVDCGRDPVYTRDFYAKPNLSLRVRDIACMEGSTVLTTLDPAKTYHVIAETDGWYKVKLADGTVGWSGSALMTKTTDDSGSGDVVTSTPTTTTTTTTTVNTALTERLKGRILLQVEDHGEAWYVHPDNGLRFYMKDGDTAYLMMRKFGLGISNANLEKVKKGDPEVLKHVRGHILLQVEAHGEAYYVNPDDNKAYYMKDGAVAYSLMREKSLGITNANLSQISYDDDDEFEEPEDKSSSGSPSDDSSSDSSADDSSSDSSADDSSSTVTNTTPGTILLSASVKEGKAVLFWAVSGLTVDQGFKVVRSTSPNPVYPGNDYHYLSNSLDHDDEWEGLAAGTYHFRVCQYLGGSCGVYSNDVTVTITSTVATPTASNGTIALTAAKNAEGMVILNWTLSNMTSPKGFKVVLADHENPVYPGDAYHYWSSPDRRSDEWTDLVPGKTYHFRVCEYLGGACGVYSNDVSLVY